MIVPSPFQNEIRHTRLVILIEDAPFTNKYRQIELKYEEFKPISDALWLSLHKAPDGTVVNLKLRGGELITLPDELQDFYD